MVKQTPVQTMTGHQQAVTKEKFKNQQTGCYGIVKPVVNQTITPVSVKLNTNISVTSVIKEDMQQKHADAE